MKNQILYICLIFFSSIQLEASEAQNKSSEETIQITTQFSLYKRLNCAAAHYIQQIQYFTLSIPKSASWHNFKELLAKQTGLKTDEFCLSPRKSTQKKDEEFNVSKFNWQKDFTYAQQKEVNLNQ